MTWDYLNIVLGVRRLGHEVYYIEDSGEWPYNFDGGPSGNDWVVHDPTPNVEYLANVRPLYEPERLALLRLACDAKVDLVEDSLIPKDWRDAPAPHSTREFGARWIWAASALAIGVPSLVLPARDDYNVLLNPLHAQMAAVKIAETIFFRPDERLLG